MTDFLNFLIENIEQFAKYAHLWGFLIVFILMTVESSFIPFPSEVVMIPAGFMAFRGELFFENPILDLTIVIICGLLGSIIGALINYYLSLKLGRPFLYKFGKYFFLSPETIERAEEIFKEYGDITTFVCRLLPAIRQLISIPAGLSKMPLGKFTFFTGLGAGIWSILLAGMGYYFAHLAGDMSYGDLVHKGKNLLHDNFLWLLLGVGIIIVIYIFVHKKIMHKKEL